MPSLRPRRTERRSGRLWLLLLRGINVGGKNVIRMTDLKAALEAEGFEDVATFIASGNVILRARGGRAATLAQRIESALGRRFAYEARVVLVAHATLRKVIREAPRGFGSQPSKRRYDVAFLRPGVVASQVVHEVPRHPEVDTVDAGTHALYFSRLIARAGQSRISRITQLPFYREMTIRTWSTATRLLALMDARRSGRVSRAPTTKRGVAPVRRTA